MKKNGAVNSHNCSTTIPKNIHISMMMQLQDQQKAMELVFRYVPNNTTTTSIHDKNEETTTTMTVQDLEESIMRMNNHNNYTVTSPQSPPKRLVYEFIREDALLLESLSSNNNKTMPAPDNDDRIACPIFQFICQEYHSNSNRSSGMQSAPLLLDVRQYRLLCDDDPHFVDTQQRNTVSSTTTQLVPYPQYNYNQTSISPSSQQHSSLCEDDESTLLQVQIMNCQSSNSRSSLFPTDHPQVVTSFLRQLLGTDQHQSVWQAQQQQSESFRPSTIVLTHLSSWDVEILVQYKITSHASPSWYLHALIQDEEVTTTASVNHNFNNNNNILIYRRLPSQRIRIHNIHPDNNNHDDDNDPLHSSFHVQQHNCRFMTIPPKKKNKDDTIISSPNEEEKEQQSSSSPTMPVVLIGPPYLDPLRYYSSYPLQEFLTPQVQEMLRFEVQECISQFIPWPEETHYASSSSNQKPWTVFPLCYCFPAHQAEQLTWIPQTCQVVPRTTKLLQNMFFPSSTTTTILRTALFSRLKPDTVLDAHTGWEDLANYVYRIHVPVLIPPGNLCGLWVDGCVETHQPDRIICFDDSKIHRAFNYSSQERVVLILDLLRPKELPMGTATGGHSEELDKFIEQMGLG